ncbi:MAG TPA: class I SAM-dependent methyltransferase [Pseudonocardia sp.]|jgi:SAM-dependent methyltransferase
MSENPPSPERIMQLATGCWATALVGTAVNLEVFTHLAEGAATAEKLAGQAGIAERGAQTLLDGLVALELIELHEGSYRNTAEAATFLVEGQPACMTGFAKFMFADMGSWSGLTEAVRTGGPVKDATSDTADNPLWEELVPAIAPQAVPVAMIAADTLKLAQAGEVSILDVGGGSGIYSAIWLGINSAARSTQLDWKPVNAIARRLVAQHGVDDRFSCIDGDFHTTDFGRAAYDVAVYSHIAHQESPRENVAIFGRFRDALRPGGTLVISDFIVEDDRSGPPFPLLFSSEMLLNTKEGGTWRRPDFQAWLTEAGFTDISFRETPTPATLIFAR